MPLHTSRTSRPMPIRPVAYACVLAALVTTACGKKGPPLAPYAKAPAAPAEVTARRLGNRVEIRFTVPTVDLDGQRPAHIDRIEVWAVTGQVPDPILFLKYATLVGTVPVRRPPPPPPDVEEGKPPPPPPPPSTEPGLDQGQPGIVVDELGAEALVPVVVPEMEKQKARDEELRLKRLAEQEPPRLTPPDLGTPLPPPLMRYYVVMGRNGGRKGASTQRLPVAIAARAARAAATHLDACRKLRGARVDGTAGSAQAGSQGNRGGRRGRSVARRGHETVCATCSSRRGAADRPARRRRRRRAPDACCAAAAPFQRLPHLSRRHPRRRCQRRRQRPSRLARLPFQGPPSPVRRRRRRC